MCWQTRVYQFTARCHIVAGHAACHFGLPYTDECCIPAADPVAFNYAAEGFGSTAAAVQPDVAPSLGLLAPATTSGIPPPPPNAALRSGMRAGLRASSGSALAEPAPVQGMIPTDAAEPAASPRPQPKASLSPSKKRRASDPGSEDESAPASSSDSPSDSDEDDFVPTSKRAKRSTDASLQRRTRAGSRAVVNNTLYAASDAAASDKLRSGRRSKQMAVRRVVAGSDSDADEPAKPLPGKGGRLKPAGAEASSKAVTDDVVDSAMLPPPPPPPPPVKQVVTAAGALRAKDVVLEVRALCTTIAIWHQ